MQYTRKIKLTIKKKVKLQFATSKLDQNLI